MTRLRGLAALALAASVLVTPLSAIGAEPDCKAPAMAPAARGGDPACPGVRPGAAAFGQNGGDCTFGFVLRGSDGARYAILGQPCAPAAQPNVGVGVEVEPPDVESVWRAGRGPRINDSTARSVGRLVYAFKGQYLDVALMRLEKGTPYSPKVCKFGGPHRINTTISNTPETVQIYGQSDTYAPAEGTLGYDDVVPRGFDDRKDVNGTRTNELTGAGAPVVAGDGSLAVGVMGNTTFQVGARSGPVFHRLTPLLELFQQRLHIRFALVNSGER